MSNSKPLPSRCSKRSSRSPRRPPKRLSLRRLPFAPLPRWLTSVKSMTNAPRLRDAVAAEVAVAAEKAATVASMVSAVAVAVVAAEAVTSMVNAVVAVVAVAVAVVVIADQETTTAKMAKFKVDADVVAPMAITGIAEVEMVTSIAVKVEEAVVIVALVIVVPALREKAAARVVAAEEKEETLMNAMDISKVTDKMALAVDVVETARVATREAAGVTRPAVKRARSHPPKRAREPLTLQRKKRRRRLLAEKSPNLSKRRKKLASPLMTTWPRSRLTQRDSLPKRQP